LAVFTFLSGIILLFSGATPAAAGRLALLDRVLPLGVIETSHFIGSLVGAALLVLPHGLARRLLSGLSSRQGGAVRREEEGLRDVREDVSESRHQLSVAGALLPLTV
jgi:lysylphosphatidylglycerol synthetase-like protein (DUF2156 family)